MKLQFNSSFFLLVVLIMIIFKQSETAGQQKRLFQKIDDLEFEMRKENVERLKDIRALRQSVDRMEEQFNNTLSILDRDNSEFSRTETSRPQTETQQSDTSKIEEVLGAFKILKRGVYEEKKVTSRLRRHVTNMQSQLDHQRNVSRELSNGVASILEAVATMTNVLDGMKNDIADVKETVIVANQRSSRIEETLKSDIIDAVATMSDVLNFTNQRINRIEEILESGATDSLENIKTSGRQMKVMLNETRISRCNKVDINRLGNKLIYNCEEPDHMASCKEIFEAGCTKSDVYRLSLETEKVMVYCDQQTDDGGWIVFQRRRDGSVNFFRDWSEYKEGFGSLTGEFWLGNENIYRLLSTSKQYELRVDLGDFEGHVAYAKYSKFRIGPESDSYRLEVDRFSGDAGDALKRHNGKTFKTKDRDDHDCSRARKGAWWYTNCFDANLNGLYNSTSAADLKGVIWQQWKGWYYSLRSVEMKFREIN